MGEHHSSQFLLQQILNVVVDNHQAYVKLSSPEDLDWEFHAWANVDERTKNALGSD